MSSAFKSKQWYQLQSTWCGNGIQLSASFPSHLPLLSSQRLAALPVIPVPMWPQLSRSQVTSLRPSCSTSQPLQDPGNNYQIPDVSALQQQELTHIMWPEPHCTTYHNVLWVQVIAEGAIIKVDLVESLLCKADHFALIEATILVLADDYLSRGQILECSLSSLRREKSLFIQWLKIKNVLKTMAPVLADNKAKHFSSGELLYLSYHLQHFTEVLPPEF